MRTACRYLLVVKLARYLLQSCGQCGCAIARAVTQGARTAATSTDITLSTGPTAAKLRCRISCCCVVRTVRCCTKAAVGLKPTVAMAGIFSTTAIASLKHIQPAPRRTTLQRYVASQRCTMPMLRSRLRPTPTHRNGLVNRSTTPRASTTWCEAQRSAMRPTSGARLTLTSGPPLVTGSCYRSGHAEFKVVDDRRKHCTCCRA